MNLGQKWIFAKEDLDAVVAGSPNPREEAAYRSHTISFMKEAGKRLDMAQATIATAALFFQRYYALRSVLSSERVSMAVTALFLAAKVDDAPRKLNDVVRVAYSLHEGRDVRPDTAEFAGFRERMLANELELLRHLGFDLTVDLPYKFLTKRFAQARADEKGIAQTAWNFVNDSLGTSLALRFPAANVGIAALYLAHKTHRKIMTVPGDKPWWEMWNVQLDDIELICREILDVYEQAKRRAAAAASLTPSPRVVAASPTKAAAAAAPPPPPPPPKSISPRPRPPIPEGDQREKQRLREEPRAVQAQIQQQQTHHHQQQPAVHHHHHHHHHRHSSPLRQPQQQQPSTAAAAAAAAAAADPTLGPTAPVAPLAPALKADVEMKERSASREQSKERCHAREERRRRTSKERMDIDRHSMSASAGSSSSSAHHRHRHSHSGERGHSPRHADRYHPYH